MKMPPIVIALAVQEETTAGGEKPQSSGSNDPGERMAASWQLVLPQKHKFVTNASLDK
jgi:hypothetical protein